MSVFTRRRREPVEHGADRLAAEALAPAAAPAHAGRAQAPAVADVHSPLPAGRPLEAALRRDFERRFDHDFSRVRVHADDALSDTAGAIGSRAFALGSHVAFARGEFQPGARDGRQLLAHELAHVVQVERERAPVRLFSKKAPGRALFYQAELDRLGGAWGRELLALRPFIAFCEAVDQELVGDLPTRLDALEKIDAYRLPPDYPGGATTTALMVRLTLLRQPAAARRYRAWYHSLPHVGVLRRLQTRRYFDYEIWYWEATLAGMRERVRQDDGDGALVVLDALPGFVNQVQAERATLDAAAVKQDAARLSGAGSLTDTKFGEESSPNVSVARYHARLGRLVFESFAAAQAPYQAALEAAAADLAAGKGSRRLGEIDKRIASALQPLARASQGFLVEINETVYRPAGRVQTLRQVDAFLTGQAALARSIRLTSYDATTSTVFPRPSQELEPARIVVVRASQIAALKRVYGLETDRSGQPTADARETQAALATLGGRGLHLHNDDDWRAFAWAKFEQRLAATGQPAEALDAVIEVLKVYLRGFTVHSPMNIDDFGDNHLTLTFPRALDGRLVHDCGVYALRIAYILSRIREHPKLKLRLRYVQLPVHVGLIITGPALPAYFVHNDTFTRYDQADLQALRAKWNLVDDKGNQRAAPAPATASNDAQFLGELAGMEFVANTHLPFTVTDVPSLGGRSATVDKAALWRSYQGLVRNELFGDVTRNPDDPAYQFHLRYLEVLEAIKRHHNAFVVPFWNGVAHPAWVDAGPRLTRAASALAAATTAAARTQAASAFDAEAARYLRQKRRGATMTLLEAFDAVQRNYGPITQMTGTIIRDLEARPSIIGPRASRTSGDRLLETFGAFAHPMWMRLTLEHLADIRTRTLTPPPFAERKHLIDRID